MFLIEIILILLASTAIALFLGVFIATVIGLVIATKQTLDEQKGKGGKHGKK